jgi:hypothetical protein
MVFRHQKRSTLPGPRAVQAEDDAYLVAPDHELMVGPVDRAGCYRMLDLVEQWLVMHLCEGLVYLRSESGSDRHH